MACQVIITEEVKAFFCTVSPAAFRAVYNCIFPACYLCSACILERDWNIFWFPLLITTKLLSMDCPFWRGNQGREYNRTCFYFDYTFSEKSKSTLPEKNEVCIKVALLKMQKYFIQSRLVLFLLERLSCAYLHGNTTIKVSDRFLKVQERRRMKFYFSSPIIPL